jgi:hypothetical protein
MGSIFFVALAVVACSNTPSTTVLTSSAGLATPSPIPSATVLTSSAGMAAPSPTPTPSPTPSPTASPRPMALATLKQGPAMTLAREGQAAVRLADGRVLLMGGIVPFTGQCGMACTAPATASVEAYDPSTGKFSPSGSLTEPRAGGEALLLDDGRVLVSGGDFNQSNTMEIYDPAKKVSVVVKLPADMQALPYDSAVVLLADGRVLIVGGSYDNLNSTSKVTLIFDPASGGFSKGPFMAQPRVGATATLLDDGRVLIVGGDDSEAYYGNANNNAEVIDPSHPLSQSTLLASQYQTASTLLADGRVLVAGGGQYDTSTGCMIPEVSEVFDPGTEKFAPAGSMSTPRSYPAAIRIQDGRVLFFGGVDSHCRTAGTVEAFDPDSGTFQVVATGILLNGGFSLTLLDDGEILIAGGSNDGNVITTATWLLKP